MKWGPPMAVQRRNINGDRIARGDLFVIPLDADDVLVPGNWHEACISKSFGSEELNATVSAISLLGDGDGLPVQGVARYGPDGIGCAPRGERWRTVMDNSD